MKDKINRYSGVICEYGFYGLLFFLPISIGLIESCVGLMLLGFIGRKITKPDFSHIKSWWNIILLAFILFSALSLFNSGIYLNKSINALFGKWVQYLIICIIIQDIASDKRILERGLNVFLFSAFLAVLSGLTQYFFGIEFLRNRMATTTNAGMRAATSSFSHYNGFGAYLVVVLTSLFGLFLSPKTFKIKKYLFFVLTILSLSAIFITFSRGSWLALFVSFILLSILSKESFKRLLPVFIVFFCIFLIPVFRERFLFIFKLGGDSDRFKYWHAAWQMIKAHPFFGLGVGTFMSNFSKYLPSTNVSYAHNCYLQIWAETGILSLLSFLIFTGSLVYFGIKRFLVTQDFILLGLLTGTAGFLIHSLFEVNLYSLQLAVLFWAWAGLIIARIRATNQ